MIIQWTKLAKYKHVRGRFVKRFIRPHLHLSIFFVLGITCIAYWLCPNWMAIFQKSVLILSEILSFSFSLLYIGPLEWNGLTLTKQKRSFLFIRYPSHKCSGENSARVAQSLVLKVDVLTLVFCPRWLCWDFRWPSDDALNFDDRVYIFFENNTFDDLLVDCWLQMALNFNVRLVHWVQFAWNSASNFTIWKPQKWQGLRV